MTQYKLLQFSHIEEANTVVNRLAKAGWSMVSFQPLPYEGNIKYVVVMAMWSPNEH